MPRFRYANDFDTVDTFSFHGLASTSSSALSWASFANIWHETEQPKLNFKIIIKTKNDMRKVVKDADKVDIQLAADCTTKGYYGLLTDSGISYFLTKVNGKWHWLSVGGDRNYSINLRQDE